MGVSSLQDRVGVGVLTFVVFFVSFVSYWGSGAVFNEVLESVFTDINGCKQVEVILLSVYSRC